MKHQISHMIVYLFLSISLPQNTFAQSTLSDSLIINDLLETVDSIMHNKTKNAKVLVDSAITIAEKIGNEAFIIKVLKRRYAIRYYLNKYTKAVKDLFTVLEYYKSQKDTMNIVDIYGDLGLTYADMMEYSLSLEYLYKAMDIIESKKDSKEKAIIFKYLGYTYTRMEKYEDALKYINKALVLSEELGDKEIMAESNRNIGEIFLYQKKYDEIPRYFNLALSLYKEINNKIGVASTYNFIGISKYRLGKYDSAIEYFKKSANIRKEIGDIASYVFAIGNIAYTNNAMGNFTKAISIYEDALSQLNEEDNKEGVIVLLNSINKVYATTGNYPKAYETLMKYSLLKNEVFNTEKSEQIEELKIEFETEQKEAEIENLKDITDIQNKSLQQRQMIIFLLVGSLALLGLLGYFGISRYQMKTEQNSMELEQRLLRSQMNPHFIFNSLSVIQGYIFKGSATEAANYLSNFGKLMRNILENSREEYVMLDKELETLNHYLELQNLRHGGKINYTINISENLPSDSVSVPPMLAQPFIENSIKHGMNENGEVSIIVKYQKSNDKMKLIIEDDGIGINKSQNINAKLDKHKSLSTSITEGRLQLLSKRAKSKYKLSIVDISDEDINKSGTRVEVELPYIEEF